MEVPRKGCGQQPKRAEPSSIPKWKGFSVIGLLMVLGILVALMLVSCIKLNSR
jgi:hypothetical protein